MRINITQYTNYDIESAGEVTKTVHVGGDLGSDRTVIYKNLPASYLKQQIHKFGYCCEPRAIQYPIFITINTKNGNVESEFQIGKTGMFEVQPEELKIEGSSETEPIEVNILGVKLPWQDTTLPAESNYHGFKFTFDFMYSTN